MADEQNWPDYADQAVMNNSDTVLARTSAGAGVEIPGTAFLRNNSSHPILYGRSSPFGGFGAETETGFSFYNGNDGYMVINNAGSNAAFYMSRRSAASTVFINFATQGTNTGSITTNGTTTAYNTTSDQRLKEDISDAADASQFIDAIQVRSFKWKISGQEESFGFIAQELLPVFPGAVYVPDNAEQMMSVDFSKLVPLLVKEIQSLRVRVASLEGDAPEANHN